MPGIWLSSDNGLITTKRLARGLENSYSWCGIVEIKRRFTRGWVWLPDFRLCRARGFRSAEVHLHSDSIHLSMWNPSLLALEVSFVFYGSEGWISRRTMRDF
jgi:hypothetical protein